jgi:hypothetical protein
MFRCVSDRLSVNIILEIRLIEKQFIVCIIALAFVIVIIEGARESFFIRKEEDLVDADKDFETEHE